MPRASLLLPPSLSWTLLLYAALVVASGWAYSALRIRTDREQTFQSEGDRLRAVAVALETGTLAMLNDGVGEAVMRANEFDSARGVGAAPEHAPRTALGKALTAGQYVRSVFVVDPGRFVLVGRRKMGITGRGWLRR